MLINRPPNRMIGEKEREEKARAESDGPRPVSLIGAGRGGSLMAFTAGRVVMSGR